MSIWLSAILFLGLVPLAFAQTGNVDESEIRNGIADLVNQYRLQAGKNVWSYDVGIERIAEAHSQEQIDMNYFSHFRPNTNVGPNIRGALGGYGICGDPVAISKYLAVGNEITEYRVKAAEYEKYKAVVEPIIKQGLAPNTQELYDELVRRYNEVLAMNTQINNRIDEVSLDIDNGKMGVGFSENEMEVNPYTEVTTQDILDNSVTGWINSPAHKEVLDGYGSKMGIGISYNESRMVITLNTC
jgi:uncharacterized protein YkwD